MGIDHPQPSNVQGQKTQQQQQQQPQKQEATPRPEWQAPKKTRSAYQEPNYNIQNYSEIISYVSSSWRQAERDPKVVRYNGGRPVEVTASVTTAGKVATPQTAQRKQQSSPAPPPPPPL